jgi:hypothetical protein
MKGKTCGETPQSNANKKTKAHRLSPVRTTTTARLPLPLKNPIAPTIATIRAKSRQTAIKPEICPISKAEGDQVTSLLEGE